MRSCSLRATFGASLKEVRRNPSIVLVALGLMGLLFCIVVVAQALTSSGEDFSAAAAMTTSAGAVAALFAGSLGVRATEAEDPLGPSYEVILGHGWEAHRWGRWFAAMTASTLLVTVPAFAILLLVDLASTMAATSTWLTLLLEVGGLSAFFAGLGAFLGSRLPTVAAYVGLVVGLIALRLGLPTWSSDIEGWSWLLPDLLRVADHLRVGEAWTGMLAFGALVAQGAALTLGARTQT